jgi:hypothetical protein
MVAASECVVIGWESFFYHSFLHGKAEKFPKLHPFKSSSSISLLPNISGHH